MTIDYFTCSVCGEHIGTGYDHKRCAKVKQEIYKTTNSKRGKKKLTPAEKRRYEEYISKLMER